MPTYGRYTTYLAERKLIPDREQGVNPATLVVPDLVRYTFTCLQIRRFHFKDNTSEKLTGPFVLFLSSVAEAGDCPDQKTYLGI